MKKKKKVFSHKKVVSRIRFDNNNTRTFYVATNS